MKRLLVLAALVLVSCTHPKPAPTTPATEPAAVTSEVDQKTLAHCCEQCTGAASRDPAGMDISVKQCTSYPEEFNGGPGVDKECAAFFATAGTKLGDCQKLAAPEQPQP